MKKTTLELTGDLDEMLEALSKSQGASKGEVIKRALALLKYLEEQQNEGNKVAITDKNDRVVQEIVPA
jgi:ribbon-helix-helix CopG family protein